MPTYEFRCPDGHEFEKFYRSIGGAESQAVCPVCGKPAGRMMSAAGFAFKGTGFYLTDYGKNAHRGEAPPDAKSAAVTAGDAPADAPKADTSPAKSDGATSDAASTESGKSGAATSAGTEAKKPEPKKSEAKPAESRPAPASPKPGASE